MGRGWSEDGRRRRSKLAAEENWIVPVDWGGLVDLLEEEKKVPEASIAWSSFDS
jgi:hypothetical protein